MLYNRNEDAKIPCAFFLSFKANWPPPGKIKSLKATFILLCWFIKETSSYFNNPILQFHGNETNDFCKSFDKEFWKVIRVKDSETINTISDYPDASAILLENYKKGIYGGTGSSFDWSILKNININDKKIIISGGINIKNVDNAISINPWCIDINSGVEISPGIKNLELTKQILKKFK